MFDIDYFRKIYALKEKIKSHWYGLSDASGLFEQFESRRSRMPYIFNIETTNVCNMKCMICPRTTEMKRTIQHMDIELYRDIVAQIRPHSRESLTAWYSFVNNMLNVNWDDHSENAFYFYVCAQAITLHGYGEPPLDPHIVERVRVLSDNNIKSYFSCNPYNINDALAGRLYDAGLTYLKLCLDGLSDEHLISVRGNAKATLELSMRNIENVLSQKERNNADTEIIITMLNIKQSQSDDVRRFMQMWNGRGVYSYVKSLDNRWYVNSEDAAKNTSHYSDQYCEFPFTSMTIMCDGSVVPCTQDYNCEMVLGNARNKPLETIWNGTRYRKLRYSHMSGSNMRLRKCGSRCDIKILSDYLRRS